MDDIRISKTASKLRKICALDYGKETPMVTLPKFQHPISTRAGRIERAVWTLRDGERQGLPVASTMAFLARKGCSDDEILEALNQASGGALVASALGE